MGEKSMPVLVGVGQVTEREFDVDSSSVLDLMEQAAYKAVEDAGISDHLIRTIAESASNVVIPIEVLSCLSTREC